MKPSTIAIKFRDFMTLVVVWELDEGYWQILSVVRMNRALALVRSSPATRLAFPTGVFPNGVWGGIYKNRTTPNDHQKADFRRSRQERVLALLENSPGQRKESLADQLGVSIATVRQLLKKLEDKGDIHHRPHLMQNKTKLYYTGTPPTNPDKDTASNPKSKSVRSAPPVAPLKVYFVDPKTLQGISR